MRSSARFLGLLLAFAQRPPQQLDGAQILHRIEKLGVVGSVLYVGAHPDDENTKLISYLSNGLKVRTAYLSLTRGDGGQNLIGTELGDALGILRTQELLEARRIDGGEQFFTRAVDFGYSKNPEETFAKWGRQEILADVVRVVRTFRPDAIVTRFATDGSGGHGHHTASAILAQEAFDLAADPKAFPDQLKDGLEPWQAKRLFFNASTWWNSKLAEEAKKDPSRWVTVDVGGYDPLLGASYSEIAGRSRSQHKSQGFGAAETRGEQIEYLRLDKGAALAKPDLLDGVETGWARVAGGEPVQGMVRDLVAGYDPHAPERSVPALSALVRALDGLRDPWAGLKAASARDLILEAEGVVVGAAANVPRLAPGETVPVTLSVLQRRPGPPLEIVRFLSPASEPIPVEEKLDSNRPSTREFKLSIPRDQTFEQPYWLGGTHGIQPAAPAALLFRCVLRLPDGLEISVDRPLMQSWVDRVDGERTRTVVVTPPASIGIADPVAIAPGGRAEVSVELLALTDDLAGAWQVSAPQGWSIEGPAAPPVEHLRQGELQRLKVGLRRNGNAPGGVLHFSFSGPKGSTDRTLHFVDHPHVLPQTWYSPADVRLVPIDLQVGVRTVGYIDGPGDDVAQAVGRMGIAVVRIDPATASAADLEKCDAIVVGIRAYNAKPALARFQPTLLAWVENGGTLLVQYNTNGNDLVMDAKRIGPYPFAITRDRVTVEEATPTFLAPSDPLWTTPNKLDLADFDGWVQERGLYFAGELDPHYRALVSWSDPGEKPLSGALIACDHGKGRFVYTGLSLFRQLPAGVPGAYRLLANLLSRRNDAAR